MAVTMEQTADEPKWYPPEIARMSTTAKIAKAVSAGLPKMAPITRADVHGMRKLITIINANFKTSTLAVSFSLAFLIQTANLSAIVSIIGQFLSQSVI